MRKAKNKLKLAFGTTLERVTPTVAADMLDNCSKNRRLSQLLVNRYAADMKAGNWKQTSQTIAIASDGSLLDGQHRLWAIVESGKSQTMLVCRRVPKSAMRGIDIGRIRNNRNRLQIEGYEVTGLQTSVLKAIGLAIVHKLVPGMHGRANGSEIFNAAKYFATDVCRFVIGKKIKGVMRVGFWLALFEYYLVDKDKAVEFRDQFTSGVGLTISSPAYILREWAISHAARGGGTSQMREDYLRGVTAMSKHRDGKTIKHLKLGKAKLSENGFVKLINDMVE